MGERTWMKACCGMCPYDAEKTLNLHPDRAEDFAYRAQNPYNDFPCHKTADLVEDDEGFGEYVHGRNSFTCHGFKALQIEECGQEEPDFVPNGAPFACVDDMIERHRELWLEQRPGRVPDDFE